MRQQINFRLDTTVVTRLDSLAERLHTSRNQLLEVIVKEALPALEVENVFRVVGQAMQPITHGAAPHSGFQGVAEAIKEANKITDEDRARLSKLPAPVQPETVEESGDVWGPKPESKHWHSFDKVIESTVEYRNGIKFATLQCECGKLSPDKSKARIR